MGLNPGGAAGGVGREATADVLFGQQREMSLELALKILIEAPADQQAAKSRSQNSYRV
jgi:hypothetical protein